MEHLETDSTLITKITIGTIFNFSYKSWNQILGKVLDAIIFFIFFTISSFFFYFYKIVLSVVLFLVLIFSDL